MNKFCSYFSAFLISLLALNPPSNFHISVPPPDVWPLCTMIVCFLGIMVSTFKVPWFIKIIGVLAAANCFLSPIPFFPFVSYYSVVVCLYVFYLCFRSENWEPIFRVLKVLVFMNIFFFIFQKMGHDAFLNYGADSQVFFGTVGQHMQMASFSVMVACVLICSNPFYFIFPIFCAFFCASTWNILTVGLGVSTYLFFKNKIAALIFVSFMLIFFTGYSLREGKFGENLGKSNGRLWAWSESIKLANVHPITGWGIGTYKVVFPAVEKDHESLPWLNAHNFLVQMAFEFGYPVTFLFFIFWASLLSKSIFMKDAACSAGLVMMATDMMVHFPDRQMQCVFIIIAFFAFCSRRVYGYNIDKANAS